MARDVTSLLSAATAGDTDAADKLAPAVYDELRRVAARMLRQERRNHTLQPTALAHEAWVKLIDQTRVEWRGRVHFLAVAATAMRRILVNHAKARGRIKRGGPSARRVALDTALESFESRAINLAALDEALERLAAFDPQQARLVELRFFGGMTMEEAAETLGISVRTAHRDWDMAKAWLRGEVEKGDSD